MSEIVPFTEVDYLSQARDNVTQQFKNKDIFDRYLQVLLYEYDNLQKVFKDLVQLRAIDQATGAQLDIIGAIVGQPRSVIVANLVEYFGFSPNVQAFSFGTLANPAIGGRFKSINEETNSFRKLTDIEYRFFIKAKIIKNTGRGTIEDMILSVKFILNNINTVYVEEDFTTIGNAAFNLSVDRSLTTTEALLLTETNILPKPAGVKLNLNFSVGAAGWNNNWGYDWGSGNFFSPPPTVTEGFNQTGNSLVVGFQNPDAAKLTTTRIVVWDSLGETLKAYDWDGSDYTQVGNSLSLAGASISRVAGLTSTTFAFASSGLDVLRTYSFDGTNFSLVGNSLSLTLATDLGMGAISSTQVVIGDSTNNELQGYGFDGSDWTTFGNAFGVGTINDCDISLLSGTTIAFANEFTNTLIALEYSAPNWAQVGNTKYLDSFASPYLAQQDTDVVAFLDNTNDRLASYMWDGTDFLLQGESIKIAPVTGLKNGLSMLSAGSVAYADHASGELRAYEFASPVSSGWNQVGNSLAIGSSDLLRITGLTSSRIAGVGNGGVSNDALVAIDFDGTNLTTFTSLSTGVDSGFSEGLAALSSSRVALYGEFDGDGFISVRTYDLAASWSLVDDFDDGGFGWFYGDVAALDSTNVALADRQTDILQQDIFLGTGSGWDFDANETLSGGDYRVDTLSSTRAVVLDRTGDQITTWDLGASVWTQVGSSFSVPAGTTALCALSASTLLIAYPVNAGADYELVTLTLSGSTWSSGTPSLLSGETLVHDLATLTSTRAVVRGSSNVYVVDYTP